MKSSSVNVTKITPASADVIWKAVASFRDIEKYSPIESSVVVGQGVGCTRTCIMPDGAELKEEMIGLDHEAKKMDYVLYSSPFPFVNYNSTVIVTPKGDNECEVSWTGNFDCDEKDEGASQDLLAGFYNAIIENMGKELGQTAQTA